MTPHARAWTSVGALAAIAIVTASWWTLALWPAGSGAPEWLLRTREVCFGAAPDGLPDAGGWILLVGQPLGMLIVLVAVWPDELRAGLALLTRRPVGQMAAGVASAAIVAGLAGVVVRVSGNEGEPFLVNPAGDLASRLTRVNQPAPSFALVNQTGETVTLEAFRGRPVLVTFAYAHCETVCPTLVADVLDAHRRTGGRPAVLIVTLDPWRDTPSRLPALARAWGLPPDVHVLSGSPDVVDRALNAWRIPRIRNEKTGDLSHPSIVNVVGPDGRIGYVVTGNAEVIAAAVEEVE
jgi:protein SCO1/2